MDKQPSVAIAVAPIRPDSIIWSENNKIAIISPSSIHILTPAITRRKEKSSRVIQHTVLSSVDQPEARRYDAVENNEGPFMTAYAVYNGFKTAAWSPVGSVVPGSCTLAVVTISHQVQLYQLQSNMENDKWELLRDLTPLFGSPYVLTSHVLCASWSRSMDNDPHHSSILALGSKMSHVSLWCNTLNSERMFTYKVIEDSDAWVTLLEWSIWYKDDSGMVAYLVVAFSNGKLSIVKVSVAQQSITALTIKTWFEKDTRAPTVLKITNSGSHFKVAVAKSSSIHIATFKHESGKDLLHEGDKWYSIVLPITTHFTGKAGMVWAPNGDSLHMFAGEYTNFSLVIQSEKLVVDDTITAAIHAKTSEMIRAQAVLNAKKAKWESKQNESYRALIWGVSPSPNGLYYSLSYTLVPLVDKELGDAGFDSYCGWLRDVQDSEQLESTILSTTINGWLQDGSQKGNTKILDVIDYVATNDGGESILNLIESLKTKCDAYGEEPQQLVSNDHLSRIMNGNPRNNTFKLLYYINEHVKVMYSSKIKAVEISEAVSETASELAKNAKTAMTWFYTKTILQMLLRANDDDWRALDHTQLSQILLLADSVLIWQPLTESTIPLVTELYQRVQNLGLGTTSQELQMISEVQTGTRPVIELNDLTPREPCPSCQQMIPLASNFFGICPSNHFWERCQLTKTVLDTPQVRSCRVCRSKIKQISPGPFQLILAACGSCIYCGSTF
ncbi:hypothetical protein INT43_006894 [Umbelopsis isabellina]|uniref:Transcription factor IIIC 90kDa subunit N-terminal domain-containing protein n=1 Tax=Mortierella isabellina TaxID=91625 RepID=A0A8H7PYV9_MORIS|nr:hypothetical protein INT43_006894 [Umbelopsis isabellina]